MDLNKLMQQAQRMQAQMQKAQEEIANSEFNGEASNGLVKVTIAGSLKVKSISIDPSIVNQEDVEMLQDLIMIAMNDAIEKLESKSQNSLGSFTNGMNIPGF